MNRRTFALGTVALGMRSLRTLANAQDYLRVTPEAGEWLGATPAETSALYEGPIDDLWERPWLVEGKLIAFNGIVIRRQVAAPGAGLPAGLPGDTVPYRAQLIMELPQVRSKRLVVASNDDLGRLDGYHTARVVGTYGGEQNIYRVREGGGASNVPLIIATSVGPVRAGTPAAVATPAG